MFDLEKAVERWKTEMRRKRSVEDGDLAELEDFLREKVDDGIRIQMGPEEAFRRAEAEFAGAYGLEDDFQRARLKRSGKRRLWNGAESDSSRIGHFLRSGFRYGFRHKGFAVLAIGSMALALAVAMLTLGWARYELSYDRFHRRADSLYRFIYKSGKDDVGLSTPGVPNALRLTIKDIFPEVVAASPLVKVRSGSRLESPTCLDFKSSIAFVGPEFLTMFDFPLVAGDPRSALDKPKSILLTESAARKFFGTADPLGRLILAQDTRTPFLVTGVLRDIPETSHLDFDFLAPFSDLPLWYGPAPKPDDWAGIYTDLYVQLAPGANPQALAARVTKLADERNPRAKGGKATYLLQALTDIHLHSEDSPGFRLSDRRRDVMTPGQIRAFLLVALIVLVMGGINYVNFVSARALNRIKEVGIRKVNGAGRADIFRQFMGESVVHAFLALAAAAVLVAVAGLPILRRLTGLALDPRGLDFGPLALIMAGATLATGILTGIYPALFLSAVPSASALKKEIPQAGPSARNIRRILIGVQVFASTALICVLAVLVLQIRYIDRKDLGYKRESLVIVRNELSRDQLAVVKRDLLSQPSIRGVATGFLPTMSERGHFIQDENTISWEGKPADARIQMDWHFVDEEYAKTYGLTLVQGRFFDAAMPTDKSNYVLNETAVRAMNLKDPVGKSFRVGPREGRIIGVVHDFHAGTLRAPIRPMYFAYASGYFGVVVQIDTARTAEAIGHLSRVMKGILPDQPLDYMFLDDALRRMYEGERRNARLAFAFSLMSLVISGLGLFGLVSFMAERRTKEIGVRKVLGASSSRILLMMTGEFMTLALISVIAAIPLAYALSARWLSGFAYRIPLSWWVFVGSGAAVLILTLAAMSWKTARAARVNPVQSLRYE